MVFVVLVSIPPGPVDLAAVRSEVQGALGLSLGFFHANQKGCHGNFMENPLENPSENVCKNGTNWKIHRNMWQNYAQFPLKGLRWEMVGGILTW